MPGFAIRWSVTSEGLQAIEALPLSRGRCCCDKGCGATLPFALSADSMTKVILASWCCSFRASTVQALSMPLLGVDRLQTGVAASFAGDFPDPVRYAEILGGYDLSAFPRLDKSAIAAIESALSVDIPRLVALFDNPF